MANNGDLYGKFGYSDRHFRRSSPYFNVDLAFYWKFEKQMAKNGHFLWRIQLLPTATFAILRHVKHVFLIIHWLSSGSDWHI